MEIGTKVLAEHPKTREVRHILSAYFTFVAVDTNRTPVPVPGIIPETEDQKRRYEEAEGRRQHRQAEAKRRIRIPAPKDENP